MKRNGALTYWFWRALAILCTVAVGAELALWIMQKDSAVQDALVGSQRVGYSLKSEEVIGNPDALLRLGQTQDAVSTPEEAASPEPDTGEKTSEDAAQDKQDEHSASPAEGMPDASVSQHHEDSAKQEPASQDEGEGSTKLPDDKTIQPTQTMDNGVLPRWRKHIHTFDNPKSRPIVSVIVTGLGLSKSSTEQALTLPQEVGLSFSPYAHDVREWAEMAQAKGYEIYLDAPMEPLDYPLADPGPKALLTDMTDNQILQNMKWLIQRTPLYVGFVSPVEEKFTGFLDTMLTFLHTLKQEEIVFIRGQTAPSEDFAKALQVSESKALQSAVILDLDIRSSAIQEQLSKLEEAAANNGYAIAIARPYPLTLRELKRWAGALSSRGFRLGPPSYIAIMKGF